tara:strand:- start:140 stop:313 length:174 start_codon:yes stop_codon:yes gene_type:complete
MENMNLYKTEIVRDGILYIRWVVAENEQQVINDFPKALQDKLKWELIDTNIDILYDL